MKVTFLTNEDKKELEEKIKNSGGGGSGGGTTEVTSESIVDALGYTPADEEDLNELSVQVGNVEVLLKNI